MRAYTSIMPVTFPHSGITVCRDHPVPRITHYGKLCIGFPLLKVMDMVELPEGMSSSRKFQSLFNTGSCCPRNMDEDTLFLSDMLMFTYLISID